jgi:hypothetical protein
MDYVYANDAHNTASAAITAIRITNCTLALQQQSVRWCQHVTANAVPKRVVAVVKMSVLATAVTTGAAITAGAAVLRLRGACMS